MVCFRYIVVNTLREGYNKYNNNNNNNNNNRKIWTDGNSLGFSKVPSRSTLGETKKLCQDNWPRGLSPGPSELKSGLQNATFVAKLRNITYKCLLWLFGLCKKVKKFCCNILPAVNNSALKKVAVRPSYTLAPTRLQDDVTYGTTM